MSSVYIFTSRIVFKFHDHIYLPAQLLNLVMKDLVRVLMLHANAHKAHHCIKQSLNVTGSIGKPGATKLVMEQYSLFTHLASECTQISIA